MAGTNYMHGVHSYAHMRAADGSGRDLNIILDKGWRMGRNQDGFGSIVSAMPPPHPLFAVAPPGRSLLETDPTWTDVYGKRPAPKTQGHGHAQAGEDEPKLCRMAGGNTALLFPKKPPLVGMARSRSEPGKLKPAAGPCRWKSRETFMAFESWSSGAPAALAAPAKGISRRGQSVAATLRLPDNRVRYSFS